MDPWDTLEIEPTHDKRAIKRAYAKKLKQWPPEDFPAEFQQLSDAYEAITATLNNSGDFTLAPDKIEFTVETTVSDIAEMPSEPDKFCVVNRENIIDSFKELLLQPSDKAWQLFFEQDVFMDFQFKKDISDDFFDAVLQLCKENKLIELKQSHRHHLLELFLWQEQELRLCDQFDYQLVIKALNQLAASDTLNHPGFIPPTASNKLEQDSGSAEEFEVDPKIWSYLIIVILTMMLTVSFIYIF